jgi:hypothetical protein
VPSDLRYFPLVPIARRFHEGPVCPVTMSPRTTLAAVVSECVAERRLCATAVGAAHAGAPLTTVRTFPLDPIGSLSHFGVAFP